MPENEGRVTPGWLVRSLLLAIWALVAWGGLLIAAALGDAASRGLGPAVARLLPDPEASPWGWLNSLSAMLALAVGLVAAGLFVWGRLTASKSEHLGE